MRPFKREYLTKEEISFFEKKFNINLSNSLVLKSPRAKVKNIIFHSLSYNKRGNSNSYTVCFDSCGFDVYCQIKCFFL